MTIFELVIGRFAVAVTWASAKPAASVKPTPRKKRAAKSAVAVEPPSTPLTEEEESLLLPLPLGSEGHGGRSRHVSAFLNDRHTDDILPIGGEAAMRAS